MPSIIVDKDSVIISITRYNELVLAERNLQVLEDAIDPADLGEIIDSIMERESTNDE